MREIKFRAWDKELKKMAHIVSLEYGVDCKLLKASCAYQLTEMEVYGNDSDEPSDVEIRYRRIDFLELMQFTGLHDKNGKEIFEGDILKWTNHTKCCNVATWDCLCEVVWESCGFYRRDILDGTLYGWANIKNEQVEVIGNIYEHPELLKEATHD